MITPHSSENDVMACHRETAPTLTLQAAQRLQAIRGSSLTAKVEERAKLCLLDYLGALVSGLASPWSQALLRYAQVSSPGSGQALVIGLDSPVSAEVAAFTNASIAHSIIRDDMHLGSGAHIGVMVIPAALALSQRENWTGEQLLKGIVAGYEMAVALGVSVRHSGSCNPHFRPSGIVGGFAAAGAGVAADDSMSLSTGANALGFGANAAAGLNEWAWTGGTEINTQLGTASRGGITSLDLARSGMHSSGTVLEGKNGLFAAYNCGVNAAQKFREWLADSECGDGIMGVTFKPFAGCNFIQTPISVALQLREEVNEHLQQIRNVLIVTSSPAKNYPGCDSYGPFERVQQTKMSLQYGVSAALLFGCIDEFAYTQYDNENLQALIRKCDISTDAEYDRDFVKGRQPCRIEICMTDGTKHQGSLQDVLWLDGPAVEDRFRQEAEQFFDPQTVDRVWRACHGLKDAQSCTQLFQLLASV